MKISVDFELEYDVANADQATELALTIAHAARTAERNTPAVTITKETTRVVETGEPS